MFTQAQALILALERYSQLPADRLSSGDHLKNSKFYTLEFTNIKDVLSNAALDYYKNTCDRMDKFESCPDLDVIQSIVYDKNTNTINEQMIMKYLDDMNFVCENGVKKRITYKKHTWEECFDSVVQKVMEDKQVRPGEITTKRTRIKTLFELAGTNYVEDITAEKVDEIKILLSQLPVCGKLYYGASVPFKQIIQLGERDKLPKISQCVVFKYLTAGRYLYKQIIQKRLVYVGNPFGHLDFHLTKAERKKQNDSRYVPFTYYDLDCIFNPANYFNYRAQPSLYFIPILSLCLGMRANECCQLTLHDISIHRTKSGETIRTIKIEEVGVKRTKTCASNRVIPIPKVVVDCGFIDYVEKLKTIHHNQDVQLFPDMRLTATGYFSSHLSTRFMQYTRSLGIHSPCKVFHSFRHTFRMNCAVNKIPSEITNIIGGWSSATVGESYANAFDIEDLYNSLNSIPHLELKRLVEKYQKSPIK